MCVRVLEVGFCVWVWMCRYGNTDGDILEKKAGRKYTTMLEVLSRSNRITCNFSSLCFSYFPIFLQ